MHRCYLPGDTRVAEMDPDDAAGDFEVDWIVDEVPQGRSSMYLVKWKGYELNIGDGREEKVSGSLRVRGRVLGVKGDDGY